MTWKDEILALIDSGISRAEIERQLGMPKNNLSSILSGAKKMPEKYIHRVWTLKSGISRPATEPDAVFSPEWGDLAAFCEENGVDVHSVREMVQNRLKMAQNEQRQIPTPRNSEEVDALLAELAALSDGPMAKIREKQIRERLKVLSKQ